MNNFEITKQKFDVIILGSGGAGLRAAISCFDEGVKNIAVISKVMPSLSHTVSAKGGVNAALGNEQDDDWRWHAYDTIKSADYIADNDAVEIMCQMAPQNIIELEKMGVVFSRNQDGKIAQRAYGGQMTKFGEGELASRACYSKDKTGHTMLHSLHQEALKRNVRFFNEFFVTDLLFDEDYKSESPNSSKRCLGVVAIDLNQGKITIFESKITIIATGGHAQIYSNTTSSSVCTGDGGGLALRAKLPLQDMEFVQFHPTGIYGCGFLITEAARSEGAYLLNGEGDRFMKNYAPKMLELASRDVVARAMANEILQNRGCGKNKAFLYLSLAHIDKEILINKLPGVIEVAKNFARVDIFKDPIPVTPSAHYVMGGVPTDVNCMVIDRVLDDGQDKIVEGLMCIGEAASTSVHGANRLGCNSLLDIIVFGKLAGINAAKILKNQDLAVDSKMVEKISEVKINRITAMFSEQKSATESEFVSLDVLKNNLKQINEANIGVFRSNNLITKALEQINQLFSQFKNYKIANKSLIYNEDLINYLEIENLFLNSYATIYSALQRKESRGAHFRDDYNLRDDQNWRCHSLVSIDNLDDGFLPKLNFCTRKIRTKTKLTELDINPRPRNY